MYTHCQSKIIWEWYIKSVVPVSFGLFLNCVVATHVVWTCDLGITLSMNSEPIYPLKLMKDIVLHPCGIGKVAPRHYSSDTSFLPFSLSLSLFPLFLSFYMVPFTVASNLDSFFQSPIWFLYLMLIFKR